MLPATAASTLCPSLALAYNATTAFSIAPSDASQQSQLVLDAYVLAAVWTGEATQWNDTRLVTLNPWPVPLLYHHVI
jgi:ABC-type phosphate transport system substrate-binding protein